MMSHDHSMWVEQDIYCMYNVPCTVYTIMHLQYMYMYMYLYCIYDVHDLMIWFNYPGPLLNTKIGYPVHQGRDALGLA